MANIPGLTTRQVSYSPLSEWLQHTVLRHTSYKVEGAENPNFQGFVSNVAVVLNSHQILLLASMTPSL